MLKYTDTQIVFQEIPDEITLAINISNCPCNCIGCHSSYLAKDIGTPLDCDWLEGVILPMNKGITCIAFMGGDSDPETINVLAKHIKAIPQWNPDFEELKVAWYSGRQELAKEIDLKNFDFIKLGPYIEERGSLNDPNTNQRLYEYNIFYSDYTIGKSWRDITSKFWKNDSKNSL